MSIPASYALELYRGDSVALDLLLWSDAAHTVPVDLTGTTAASQLRDETGALLATFACTVETPNTVHVRLAASAWPSAAPARARWDVQLTYPSGTVRTVLAGPVQVVGDVTVGA